MAFSFLQMGGILTELLIKYSGNSNSDIPRFHWFTVRSPQTMSIKSLTIEALNKQRKDGQWFERFMVEK